MSQSGQIVWFTESTKLDMMHIIKELPRLMGFDRADSVYRSNIVDENNASDTIIEFDRSDYSATMLHQIYVPGKFLSISAEAARMGVRLGHAIQKGVSETIRGKFLPNRPYIHCGKHFLYDDEKDYYDDPKDPAIFARPTLTIGCWGYSTALKWKEMRSLVFKLPEVVEEKHRLEHLIGKLEQAIYWSI